MFRSLCISLVAGLLLAASGGAQSDRKSALNKAELEAYVRHLWVLPPTLIVAVADPQPSELPGFQDVHIKLTQGQASQDVLLYVSKDGSKILQGNVYDVNLNPFKKDLDKLQTSFQPSLGTPGATVVLVLFSDMQCPYCKAEAQMLRQNLLATYPTQVRLYFNDFPLEQLHPWAKSAAMAGRCVFHQDPAAFWDFHDFIYAHQESTTLQNLKQTVTGWSKERKDIDTLQLGSCLDGKETEKEVEAEMAKGQLMQVDATPTLFVNGRRMPNSVEWPALKATIDNEIAYQKVAKNAGEDCGCENKLDVPGLAKPGVPTGSPLKK